MKKPDTTKLLMTLSIIQTTVMLTPRKCTNKKTLNLQKKGKQELLISKSGLSGECSSYLTVTTVVKEVLSNMFL